MSILTRFLALYSKSGLRGSYRTTKFLSNRFKSLQCIPIKTSSGIIYADLRIPSARGLLGNPKSLSGEDILMRKLVKKGDVVFDIGAHLGLYTLLLSEIVGKNGKVYAFEPNPELLPSLNLTVAPLGNVKLQPIALSDKQGEVNLFVPEDPTMASLTDWTNGTAGVVHKVICEKVRLDDFVNEKKLPVPNFIKCDVEGAELSVFLGGAKTLDSLDAPIIMFEVNAKAAKAFGVRTNSYFEFLESLSHPKYLFFEVLTDGKVKEFKNTEIEFTNIVAIPSKKSHLLKHTLNNNLFL